MRKKREEGAKEAAYERVDGNRGIGVEAVAVDQVRHSLPEGHHAADADEGGREDGGHPGGALGGGCGPWDGSAKVLRRQVDLERQMVGRVLIGKFVAYVILKDGSQC